MKDIYRAEPGEAQLESGTLTWTDPKEPISLKNEDAELLLNANPDLYSESAPKKSAASKKDGD